MNCEENYFLNKWASEERWIEWNVQVFTKLLQPVIASRVQGYTEYSGKMSLVGDGAEMPLESVKEIIELPNFDKRAARRAMENKDMEVPEAVSPFFAAAIE